MNPRRWPRPLQPGDGVAVIAPAGPPVDPVRVDAGLGLLRSWGYHPEVWPGVWAGDVTGFLAATDETRLADLHDAFADPEVAAVVCVRGGYGCQRLLDALDEGLLGAHPKWLLGFSDVTALHTALGQRAGVITLHGPSLQWDAERLGEAGTAALRNALAGDVEQQLGGQSLVGGAVTAPLVGGNLTVLSTLCGTRDQLDANGCALLLEDVAERPYRLDRALVHLRRAGVLQGAAALVLDGFHHCTETRGDRTSATAQQVVAAHAAELDVPAVYGLPLGHGPGQRTVPLGGLVTVDGDAGTVTVHPRSG